MPQKKHLITVKAIVICFIAALFYSYEYLVRVEPSFMVPMLLKYYQTNAFEISLLGSIYYYSYMPMQLVVGFLLDRYFPHKMLIAAALTVTLGLVMFTLSGNLIVADISRFLIGFGSAFAFIGAFKLGTIWLPSRVFSVYTGLVLAMGMFGAILADSFHTAIMTALGWKNTTYLIAFVGLIITLLIVFFVKDQDATHKATSKSAITIADLIIILRQRQQWINALITMLLFLPVTVFGGLWGIPFFENVYDYDQVDSGRIISLLFFGILIGSPFIGWLSEIVENRKIILGLSSILSCIFISIVLYHPNISPIWVMIFVFAYAFFTGAIGLNYTIAKELTEPKTAASAMAFANMMSMLSGVGILPLIGLFLVEGWQGVTIHGENQYPAMDYQFSLIIMPIGLFIAGILTIFLKETFPKSTAVLRKKKS